MLEWQYFNSKKELFSFGSLRSPGKKYFPAVIEINPTDFDVLWSNVKYKIKGKQGKYRQIKPEMAAVIQKLTNSWDPRRGTAPLGIVEGDSTPTCAFSHPVLHPPSAPH